jgi:hypothetical protein
MGYRFVFLNSDYPEFLRDLYARHPGLDRQPYDVQLQARNDSLFGVADYYPYNLRQLGYEGHDLHFNNEHLQKAWAREHGLRIRPDVRWEFRLRRRIVPWVSRVSNSSSWMYDILKAQIRHYRPDVLLHYVDGFISSQFLKEVKPYTRLLVGQLAAPFSKEQDYGCYDLMISSLPNFVERFRQMGLPAELHRLGFEPRVLSRLKPGPPRSLVSFVGSLTQHHADRVQLLEYLCARLDVEVWGGQDVDSLPENSAIRHRNKGSVWGLAMYQVLHQSKMTLNHHIGVAEGYANNMRLYEATGVGTLLITDWKVNLHEMFEPGKEVVAYRTPEECAELIKYYLEHEDERAAIAAAGQRRTLSEHGYPRRMQELVDIVRKYL